MKILQHVLCALFVLVTAGSIHGASFDCSKAGSEVEKLICADAELSKLDEAMDDVYQEAFKTRGKVDVIKSQWQWLKNERNTCNAVECLRKAYKTRIQELTSLLSIEANRLVSGSQEIEETPEYRETLLDAVRFDFVKEIESWIENGGDVNSNLGKEILMDAAHRGNLEIVKLLIWSGAEPNLRRKDGRTLLMVAICGLMSDTDMVKFLVEYGADVTARDEDGQTALLLGAWRASPQTMDYLISKGASINVVNNRGYNAFLYAARGGHLETLKLLLEKGADINFRSKDGNTAVMEAAGMGHFGVVAYLAEKGADLDGLNGDAPPVLMNAGKNEYVIMINRNECLCKDLMRIYNDDIKKYGKVNYEHHDEFYWPQWRKKTINMRPAGEIGVPRELEDSKMAIFDINNDSEDEIVIHYLSYQSDTLLDYYDIFNSVQLTFFDDIIDGGVFRKMSKKTFSNINPVQVNINEFHNGEGVKLPVDVKHYIDNVGKNKHEYVGLGDHFFNIYITNINNIFYIIFEDKDGNDYRETTKYNIVTKMHEDFTLNTQCIFVRKSSVDEKEG